MFPATPQLNTGGCPYRGLTYRPGYMKSLNPNVECALRGLHRNPKTAASVLEHALSAGFASLLSRITRLSETV